MKRNLKPTFLFLLLALIFASSAISAQKIELKLINAKTNQAICDLSENLKIDILQYPEINIQAVVTDMPEGEKCSFVLDGPEKREHAEGGTPFALFGDNNGNYFSWTPVPGVYSLRAWVPKANGKKVNKWTNFIVENSSIKKEKLVDIGVIKNGIKTGPNFVVFEAEATKSDLGKWEIVKPGDPRYCDKNAIAPIGNTQLEFTGNNKNAGPATSPLEYTFVCPKTATYRLVGRMYQRLEGEPEDKCNDVYVRMAGNLKPGGKYTDDVLRANTKFYGRGVDQWGVIYSGDHHEQHHQPFLYKMNEGEEYTLTISGRAQRTTIDYFLLYDIELPIVAKAKMDLAEFNDEIYRPYMTTTIKAVDFDQFTGLKGYTDAKTDKKKGMQLLQIPNRLKTAAAQMKWKGKDGLALFKINAIQESDGECTYVIKVNGKKIGECTNDRIHGTEIPDYTVQTHLINKGWVELKKGDLIQVEFSNATNGLVPEGELTATARGRWLSLEISSTADTE